MKFTLPGLRACRRTLFCCAGLALFAIAVACVPEANGDAGPFDADAGTINTDAGAINADGGEPWVDGGERDGGSLPLGPTPLLSDVVVTPGSVSDGGVLTLSVEVEALNAPVRMLFVESTPYLEIEHDDELDRTVELGANRYRVEVDRPVSPLEPSGEYRFGSIRVQAGINLSAVWPDEVSATVDNPSAADAPVLTAVGATPLTIEDGGDVTFAIEVDSAIDLSAARFERQGPEFSQTLPLVSFAATAPTPGSWVVSGTDTLLAGQLSGDYVYSAITVVNAFGVPSTPWPTPITVVVDNPLGVATPVVTSVDVSPLSVNDGVPPVTLSLTVASSRPLETVFFRYNNDDVDRTIEEATETSPGIWAVSTRHFIWEFAASGTYTYSDFAVSNIDGVTSEAFSASFDVEVTSEQD